MIRKLLRFSRVALAVVALLGLLGITLFGLFGEKVLRSEVEKRLAQTLKRPVRVGSLSVDLASRTVEIRDLEIPGGAQSPYPTLQAEKVRLALSFRSLATSKILLRRLELEKPKISIQVLPDGSTDLPEIEGSTGSSSRTVSIGAVAIRSGELRLNDRRIPLDLLWPNVEASLASDARNLLKGDLSAGPGPMQFADRPPLDARLSAKVRFADSVLHLDEGAFDAGPSRVSLSGRVDLKAGARGEIQLAGPVDLDSLDRSILGTGLGLRGIAHAKGTLSFEPGRQALATTLEGRQGQFDSLPIDGFSTSVAWNGADVRLKDLKLDALGGTAALDVLAPEQGDTQVKGRLDGMNAEPLLTWLFDYSGGVVGARVSGPIDLSFPEENSALLSGSGDLTFVPEPGVREPLSGRVPFSAARGVITLAHAELAMPATVVALDGAIQPNRTLGLDVRLDSEDLQATDLIGTRLRKAFGSPEAQPLGFVGRGRLEGRITGSMDEPVVTGRFSGAEIAYLGVAWGQVDWHGRVSPLELRSETLVATRGSERVELRGMQRLGATGVDDALDLDIQVGRWPARELLRVVDAETDIETNVSGSLKLQGTRQRPLGSGSLSSASGTASGIQYANGDLKLRFEGDVLRIESLKAIVGGGELTAQGAITDESGLTAFAGGVNFRNVELADLGLQSPDTPPIGGRVTGRATLSGPLERPNVQAHLESNRIFYGDEGIGAVALDVAGKGDGVIAVTGRADSPRFSATVEGTVQAKAPYTSRLAVKLANARIDPVMRALGSRFENAVVITASANADLQGPLQEPDRITARVRDTRLRIAVPEYAIEAAPGALIDVENRELRIANLTLTGESTSLAISGKLALRPDADHDLSMTGRADMRVLSGFLREWRLRGAATLRSRIRGTPRAIRVTGGLDIEDGAVRIRTFPQGLDGLNGRIVFNETQARVAGLEGRFGGGRVSVSGQVSFGGAVPPSFDFFLNGDSLGLRYPEGLRATFGAALRLQGTPESHWLTGDMLVSKAIWTRKYAITSELFSSQTATATFAGASGFKPSPMRLDIAIRAPGTLRLDNNIADLAARADLTLTGSPTEPQLLGRVEIERGKVYFNGNTYEVRKGVAHFSNPREVNPVFDIEADTRLRNHRLTLQANGTLDRVTTRITSDPPLTTAQIASLLTGGDEDDVINVASSSIEDLKALGTGGVNTFASTWLDENITGRVAQGFGLSRLSIDPGRGLLSRSGSRLTVGKRVTSDLEVLYTRNIFGGNENQYVQAEYSLSNRFSLAVSWAETEGFGADVRTRFVLKK